MAMAISKTTKYLYDPWTKIKINKKEINAENVY
jgi:hypothetical protein